MLFLASTGCEGVTLKVRPDAVPADWDAESQTYRAHEPDPEQPPVDKNADAKKKLLQEVHDPFDLWFYSSASEQEELVRKMRIIGFISD